MGDNDDILEEYEVILSHINDVSFHIFQFPMTSSNNKTCKRWQSAFIRPDGGSFQLTYYSNNESEENSNNSDETKSYSSSNLNLDNKNICKTSQIDGNNKHLYTVNSKSCLSSSNCLVIGYFDHENKKLYISPISTVQQFRPNFSCIDQKRLTNVNVGMVERSTDVTSKNERNQSLEDLILNHGNDQLEIEKNNNSTDLNIQNVDKGRFFTTGAENWIKIPCIYQEDSYESKEIIKTLIDMEFDDFISWKDSNKRMFEDNMIINQLLSKKHNRNRINYFDNDKTKYLKIISGIIQNSDFEFNLPFGGNGQVLPSLRTAGLPKIYTAYQYPPSSPSSSLGNCMSYNFGNIEDSNINIKNRDNINKNNLYLPFHGISGKLLAFDDWLHFGPISIQELSRMKLSNQIQRITLVYQVIPFYGIKLILRRVFNAMNNYYLNQDLKNIVKSQNNDLIINDSIDENLEFPTDQELIRILKRYCVLVSGNWVYKSELLYNEYESCCRDLILVLLQRDENAGLNREPIRVATDLPQIKVTNILQEIAVYRSTAWYPKFSFDKKFIEENFEEANYWKNYWSEREKYVVQYIRDNRDTSICTSTYLNNLSAVSTSIGNSQLQLLLIFILRIYGAMNISELLNLCIYHLTLMSVGNASLTTIPTTIGSLTNEITNNTNKISNSSNTNIESNSLNYNKIGIQNKSIQKNNSISSSFFSSISSNQNFVAPTYSPFCSSYTRHNMKQISFINVNSNISSIKINKEDINKSLEIIATKIFDDLWVLNSTGDPRIDSIRKIVIDYFGKNAIKEDIFTITSFIDNIKQSIIKNCAISFQKNKIWNRFDSEDETTKNNETIYEKIPEKFSQLLVLLNNVPEFTWRKIIHEFAFPINETATVWKLKSK